MLFKPKGWDELSPIDQAWVKKVSDWSRELEACIDEKNDVRLKFILNAHPPPDQKERYALACRAIEKDNADGLRRLLEAARFDYNHDAVKDKSLTCNLFRLSAGSADLWGIVYDYNQRNAYRYWALSQEDIILQLTESRPRLDTVLAHLNNIPSSEVNAFIELVNKTIPDSEERAKAVLLWTDKFQGAAPRLNDVLVRASKEAGLGEIKALVKAGAYPNYLSGLALYSAAEAGRKEVVEFLLSVTDMGWRVEDIAEKLRKNSPESPCLPLIEQALGVSASAVKTPATQEEFTLSGSSTISNIQKIPGMTLTTVFNFTLMTQTQIIEKGAALTATTTGFQDVDSAVIENMRQKLVALGGKAENTVHRLPKLDSPGGRPS